MERLSRSLRALARAETLIARIWLTVAAKRGGLVALAVLVAALGFGMLNVAGYFALAPVIGPVWAAVVVALADFVLAAILLAIVSSMRPGRDLDLALELRDNAIEEIASVAAHPASLAGRALIGPLAGLILGQLRSVATRGAGAPKQK
jgi:hypothetical protein